MVIAAAVVLALGCLYLCFTFVGPKLRPRDPAVVTAMQSTSLVITRQTTVWKAWLGFNASHSLAAILFSLIYGYLPLAHPAVLFDSWFLQAVGLCLLIGFVVLARAYWFRVPLVGVCASLACYLASIALAQA